MSKISLEEIKELSSQLQHFNSMIAASLMMSDGDLEENKEMDQAIGNLAHGAITTNHNVDYICKQRFGRKLDMKDVTSLAFKGKLPDKK